MNVHDSPLSFTVNPGYQAQAGDKIVPLQVKLGTQITATLEGSITKSRINLRDRQVKVVVKSDGEQKEYYVSAKALEQLNKQLDSFVQESKNLDENVPKSIDAFIKKFAEYIGESTGLKGKGEVFFPPIIDSNMKKNLENFKSIRERLEKLTDKNNPVCKRLLKLEEALSEMIPAYLANTTAAADAAIGKICEGRSMRLDLPPKTPEEHQGNWRKLLHLKKELEAINMPNPVLTRLADVVDAINFLTNPDAPKKNPDEVMKAIEIGMVYLASEPTKNKLHIEAESIGQMRDNFQATTEILANNEVLELMKNPKVVDVLREQNEILGVILGDSNMWEDVNNAPKIIDEIEKSIVRLATHLSLKPDLPVIEANESNAEKYKLRTPPRNKGEYEQNDLVYSRLRGFLGKTFGDAAFKIPMFVRLAQIKDVRDLIGKENGLRLNAGNLSAIDTWLSLQMTPVRVENSHAEVGSIYDPNKDHTIVGEPQKANTLTNEQREKFDEKIGIVDFSAVFGSTGYVLDGTGHNKPWTRVVMQEVMDQFNNDLGDWRVGVGQAIANLANNADGKFEGTFSLAQMTKTPKGEMGVVSVDTGDSGIFIVTKDGRFKKIPHSTDGLEKSAAGSDFGNSKLDVRFTEFQEEDAFVVGMTDGLTEFIGEAKLTEIWNAGPPEQFMVRAQAALRDADVANVGPKDPFEKDSTVAPNRKQRKLLEAPLGGKKPVNTYRKEYCDDISCFFMKIPT